MSGTRQQPHGINKPGGTLQTADAVFYTVVRRSSIFNLANIVPRHIYQNYLNKANTEKRLYDRVHCNCLYE